MLDLTSLKTYIIDSEDPHEVDDALSLEYVEGKAYKLWIHISNPCKLFISESEIDIEARKKNSSVYLTNDYISMLPETIINTANLKQNKVSETISACLEFNDDGSIKNYEILEATINPKYQLTFEDADEIIELEPKEEFELITIKNLLLQSINYRKNKGAIIFDMPNNKIRVNNGKVIITNIQKNVSQLIISESMILMGYITSLYLSNNNISAPYRSQKINCDAKAILDKYKDSVIKYSILKQFMGKSYVSTKPNNHESLGLTSYVQCTSPLRRYLDLVVQRQVYNKLNNYKLFDKNKINELIDYSRLKQLEINNIYKNDKLKYLKLFFTNENRSYYKIILIKWINYKRNIALVYLPEYSLEILIILYTSVEIYINKIYKVKYNISNNIFIEFSN